MNFLVIGVGSAGQRHLRVLHNQFGDKASIYAYRGNHKRGLISADLQSEDSTLDPIIEYGAKEIVTAEELRFIIWDLIIIATPPDSHLYYTRLVIESTKRLLIEKPISVSFEDAHEIYMLANLYHIPVCIGYQLLFHPLKALILSNIESIGSLTSYNTTFEENIKSMNPFRDMSTHHLAKPLGGGVFLSLSHDLDFMLAMLELTELTNISFSDCIYAENGVLLQCKVNSTGLNKGINLQITNRFSILPGKTKRLGEIRGEKGSICWDLLTGKFQILDPMGHIVLNESFVNEKDQLFAMQIESILSDVHLTRNCQSNLLRAKFITKISSLHKSQHS